jgi:hypothetical protein
MTSVFLELIKQLNGSVIILLLILIVIFIALFKLGNWQQKFSDHDERVKKIEGLAEKVVALTIKVDLIYQNTNPKATILSRSPIVLSAVGNEIADKLKAVEIFGKYAKKLISEVDKRKPNNAYDIQNISMEVAKTKMLSMLDEAELLLIKSQAFENGIIVEDIMSIFGVFLRNQILQERGMSISDVDDHDPEKIA